MELEQSNVTQVRDLRSTSEVAPKNEKHHVTKSWAFESGSIVEQGTVLLYHPPDPQEEFGFGLGKQYLHKSSILILDHSEKNTGSEITKGVILNRPTDLFIDDVVTNPETNEKKTIKWKIWYGGELFGIHSDSPKLFCLHSLSKNEYAMNLSEPVFNGIYFTPLDNARLLVATGSAVPSDFWVFSGVVPFKPKDLFDDIDDGIWHPVSTDARTLRKGLRILSAGGAGMADPRDAGERTWSMLMEMIGKEYPSINRNGIEKYSRFDDLMLKVWANENLMFKDSLPKFLSEDYNDDQIDRRDDVFLPVGTLIRSSSSIQSKYLLSNQEFHKSIVLIIQDDSDMTVGVILNRPSAMSIKMKFKNGYLSGKISSLEFPVQYGGPFAFNGVKEVDEEEELDLDDDNDKDMPSLFLHRSSTLRNSEIGEPIGLEDKDVDGDCRIWKCTMDEVVNALHEELAEPNDFIAIDGFCVWTKSDANGSIQSEIRNGNFDILNPSYLQMNVIWDRLAKQGTLNEESIHQVLELSEAVWLLAGMECHFETEEKKECVFKSNVSISTLRDIALETWVASFLLGEPRLCPAYIDESP